MYITGAQEATLKKHSAISGSSEAELVRAALDEVFGCEPKLTAEQREAFEAFLSAAERVRPAYPREEERIYVRSSNYERRFHFKLKQRRPRAESY